MWIAKNSITGKTYGKKFKDIYDCQAFINTKLFLLEYEFRRCFSLEDKICFDIEHEQDDVLQRIGFALQDFSSRSGLEEECHKLALNLFKCKKNESFKDVQKRIDLETQVLSDVRWQRNNIIRCWYVEQNRFADGFDF